MYSQHKGFTLIELMIVVLVMSLVLGLSIPTYRNYSLRAGRADASNALLRIAAAQERFYLAQGQYATSAAELTAAPPNGLGFTGAKSERGYYDLTVAVGPSGQAAVDYQATATVDTGSNQKDDSDCTSLSVDQSGRRGANGGYVAATVEKCWR